MSDDQWKPGTTFEYLFLQHFEAGINEDGEAIPEHWSNRHTGTWGKNRQGALRRWREMFKDNPEFAKKFRLIKRVVTIEEIKL